MWMNMIAFEVQKNGQKLCTAGVAGLGVVFVMTRWVARQEPEGIERFCDVDVFGQADAIGKHQQWANEPLKSATKF